MEAVPVKETGLFVFKEITHCKISLDELLEEAGVTLDTVPPSQPLESE